MSREQKRALAILIAMSLVLIILGIAIAVRHVLQVRWLSILLMFLAVAVSCAGGLAFFRLRPDRGAVAFDERDKEIQRNANLTGLGMAYLFLMLATFAPGFILGEKASIPVTWLPGIYVGVGLCHAYTFFISLLVQYGRGGQG